jgi:hypothetical protein
VTGKVHEAAKPLRGVRDLGNWGRSNSKWFWGGEPARNQPEERNRTPWLFYNIAGHTQVPQNVGKGVKPYGFSR